MRYILVLMLLVSTSSCSLLARRTRPQRQQPIQQKKKSHQNAKFNKLMKESRRLTAKKVGLFYQAKTSKLSDEKLAFLISEDYRDARDEFTLKAAFEEARSVFDVEINMAEEKVKHISTVTFGLPKYDFERGGFPTNLTASSSITLAQRSTNLSGFQDFRELKFNLIFENAEDFSFLSVDEKIVKKEASRLARTRDAKLVFKIRLLEAMEEDVPVGYLNEKNPTVKARIERVYLVYTPSRIFIPNDYTPTILGSKKRD